MEMNKGKAMLALTPVMEMNIDEPGLIGFSYPMLTRSNYTAWSLKMKAFMQAQGVWSAVEPNDPNIQVEEKKDNVAMAMIYQGIPDDVLLALAEKQTAKEAWEAIKTIYQGVERVKQARIQTLISEFESMSMKDNELIDDFYMRLMGLVTNIRALGEEMGESYVVKKLLRAVPRKFLQIISAMEQFCNLETMTVEEAVGFLKAYEERLKGKVEQNERQLMLTEEEWTKREGDEGKLLLTREEWLRGSNRGGLDGRSSFKSRGGRDRSKVRCYKCNIYGHYAHEC
ncbi:uncharacterized protein LOC108226405 [Daucus carota subsp. sativus]|uniref:uncharacterized protein LOC108226405 n=1 Tax=Daucus carota subsp. sativus TaxID=79200 RepID=UPI0007F0216B|nr:PREDICTED: uncharacterized protein LOC108226405 [Daucus carota subsp. sativus]